MNQLAPELLPIAGWLLVVLSSALVAVLVWIGRTLIERMDGLQELIKEMRKEQDAAGLRIWQKLDDHGHRITRLETRQEAAS